MSSVSFSGVGGGLFQYLQNLNGAGPTVSTDTAATNGPDASQAATAAAATASPAAATTQSAAAAAGPGSGGPGAAGRRHHHRGHGEAFQRIQAAVMDALKTAQSGGSSGDVNKAVEDAIAKALKDGGGGPPAGGPGQGGPAVQGTSPAPDGTGRSGDGDGDANGANAHGGTSARSAFASLLQSYGIDENQFRADFAAAIRDARGGTVDPSTAFRSFPTGTTVDTTA